MSRDHQDLPWPPPGHQPRRPAPDLNALADPATQIVGDQEAYLGQGLHEVGRRVAEDQVELFVAGDAALGLQQQLERHAPDYIALHDLGTSATLHLLNALATAAGARVQRLSVRRQGQGAALAVLPFVEVPLAGGQSVRVYTTDVQADGGARQTLGQVLLARSRLAVLMLGEVRPSVMAAALLPLREGMGRAAWVNHEMLVLPLGASPALAAQAAAQLTTSTVAVRVTPQAARPNDAWAFIAGAWNRQQQVAARPIGVLHTELNRAVARPQVPLPEAPTEPMPLAGRPAQASSRNQAGMAVAPAQVAPTQLPEPAVHENTVLQPISITKGMAPAATGTAARWADYAQRCCAIKGVVACCVFDLRSQLPLAHVGECHPSAERLAIQGGLLMDGMANAGEALGAGETLPEAAISFGQHHLLLRPVPGHGGVVLHLVLQASTNNLTLARMQLERVTPPNLSAVV
jgi:hypothetical protein